MHGMFLDVLTLDRPERTDPNMKRHIDQFHALFLRLLQQFVGKVKSRRRCRYRALLLTVHRLISFLILFLTASLDVWRKRHAPQFFQPFHEQSFILKFHQPGSIVSVILHLRPQQRLLRKDHAVPGFQPFPRLDHSFPDISLDPLDQQEFHLGASLFFRAKEPCREHLGIVQHQTISRL